MIPSTDSTRDDQSSRRMAKGGALDVEYPGFGEIVTAGVRFGADVVLERGQARRRKKGPSKAYRDRFGHTPLSADETIPWSASRLVIRIGADGRLPVME